ncbi:MAG: amidohydrolase [Chitinophagaceae bacterium]|nr:amidohydrolase [Chitinophagaceae bacterium]HMN33333.1 amidohydrolase [Chitinophagaceae bacterium]
MFNNLAIINELTEKYLPEFISFREHIHAHPELSFQEENTAKFISNKLTEFGIAHQTHIAGTGIVALIEGKNPSSRIIALRADMDALPIQEQNLQSPYCSQNAGVMHACGHDAHSACLLGAAKILNETKNLWEGTIKCIFQPGEEKHPGGASLLIKEGVLENPVPQAIFALHVYPHLPYGKVGFRQGQYMASADEIYITINGRGGHAALPHQTIDPITIASNVIISLQQIISRNNNPLNPSVLSFGKIAGGNVGNVIPETVRIEGTLRCMDETWRAKAHQLINQYTTQICEAMGASAKVEIPLGYPFLYNDPQTTAFAEKIAHEVVGKENVVELNRRMAAEDFSFYTHHIPGCFFRIGTAHNDQFTLPVHNAGFDIYQPSIGIGVQMFCAIAMNFN